MVMTDKTKITLSDKELDLVCNTDWILTKQRIINKVVDIFGELLISMQQVTTQNKNVLPIEIFAKDPKISKGENYLLLPYVMLDYPRYFGAAHTVAIRTMFWWGNFFSISLLIAGSFKESAVSALIENFLLLQQNSYGICIHENPWQHHFGEDNYILLAEISLKDFEKIIYQKSFIKIAKKISLRQWDTVTLFAKDTFEELINLLEINYLNDEIDL